LDVEAFSRNVLHFMKFLSHCLLLLLPAGLLNAGGLKIMGSPLVQPPVSEAAKILIKQGALECDVSSGGGTEAGLAALGEGVVKIVMMARHIQPEDRAALPSLNLTEVFVGEQVASLCVSADVWNSGIHQLTEEQIRSIYEGRTKNWKELGGPDQKITFYNWDEGLGMWELLATWLYESTNKAPRGRFTPIQSNEEAGNALEFTQGSIAVMSPKQTRIGAFFPVALSRNGQSVEPSVKNVASGVYSLTRPLVLVVDGHSTGPVKVFIDFLLSPAGQECFAHRGFFTAAEVNESLKK
jgi:phosphate transport system substrate-binding protein